MTLFSDLNNPDSPVVRAALTRRCEVCKARPDEDCRNTMVPGTALPGRLVHYARTVA